jgi:hypothetical protein
VVNNFYLGEWARLGLKEEIEGGERERERQRLWIRDVEAAWHGEDKGVRAGMRAAMKAMIEGGNLDIASHTSRTIRITSRLYDTDLMLLCCCVLIPHAPGALSHKESRTLHRRTTSAAWWYPPEYHAGIY